MLSQEMIDEFCASGHLTVPSVFNDLEIEASLRDLEAWSSEFLQSLPDEKRNYYLEQPESSQSALRKLDHPVFLRPAFKALATHPSLVAAVRQLIGEPVSIFFSQVFMKPPGIGGPKPIHQDNFYFRPSDPDAALTAWIALDEATEENGCLFYSVNNPATLLPHHAPPDEPFNLQIEEEVATQLEMRAAPVPRGGVSFHHGHTPHQSSANRSSRPRRAVAVHYLRAGVPLKSPAFEFNPDWIVEVS